MDELIRIREALEYYRRFFGVDPAALEAVEALEVLAHLEGYVFPTMPAEWLFEELTCVEPDWFFCMRQWNTSRYVTGKGPSPVAAMLAAFARVASDTAA